ncbi:Hypothetical predicted protein [Paramuricea clavata]|uniref:Uncharacterized protein n=1 Tax=Paramuricea clavata TaxID=317549 RepID=A0A6S7LHD2_PARCT|nr:Hypothetical predicted protein [Paramuricea clavata]
MAESFSAEIGKSAQAVGEAFHSSISCSGGGNFSITISSNSAQVVKYVCITAVSLSAVYAGYQLMGKKMDIDSAVTRSLGGERDDQEIREIKPGSLHVLLSCFTDQRFLEILEDYECGRMKERLEEEFEKIGIEVEGLKVEIDNMEEVKQRKEIIVSSKKNKKNEVENVGIKAGIGEKPEIKQLMSLTGIILDVSGSMKRNIGSGTDEEGGPWVQSIFNVIDDLIEHDLTSEDRVFAIGVGAECPGKEIFDVIATLQQFENTNMPATEDHINEILDILERNGARNIRNWACNVKLIQDVLSEYMATLTLREFESDKQFVKKFVDEFLPSSCRDKVQTASHAGGGQPRAQPQAQPQTQPFNLSERSAEFHSIANLRRRTGQALFLDPETARMTFTNQGFHFQSRGAQNDSLDSWGSWLFGGVLFGLRKVGNGAEDATSWTASCFKSATREDIEEVVRKAKRYFEDASRILKDIGTHSIFSVQDASRIIRGCVGEKELNELSNERKQELLENVEPFIYGGTPLYGSLEKAIKLFEGDTSENKLLFVLSDGEPADGSIKDISKINQITSKLNEAGVKTVSCFITASTNIDPKRLYDEMPPDWKPGPKFLFSLSSEVSTQHLPRAILVKRGWTIDVANNETKLFMQVNHPDNVR